MRCYAGSAFPPLAKPVCASRCHDELLLTSRDYRAAKTSCMPGLALYEDAEEVANARGDRSRGRDQRESSEWFCHAAQAAASRRMMASAINRRAD